jgi:hypothetical protein
MLEIKLEGLEKLQEKLDKVKEQVLALHHGVPKEMVDWQAEDMRRKYPNIEVADTPSSLQATTKVWPRSRLEQEQGFKRPVRPALNRGPRQVRPKGAGRPPPSVRPILRISLLRRLFERVIEVGKAALKWP